MPGKIFVNYRRDDGAANAARLRDRLAGVFGAANVFMDVDNLLAGQRFDKELEKALAQADVFLVVIGPRWMELLKSRTAGDERDYVREEIAGALRRGIVVIPVLVERALLPRGAEVPEDIRKMVLHQKQDITHEHFGRDTEALIAAIKAGREAMRAEDGSAIRAAPLGWLAAGVAATVLVGWVGLYQMGLPVWPPWPAGLDGAAEAQKKAEAVLATQAKRKADEDERQRLAMLKSEEDRRRAAAEAKRKTDEAAAVGVRASPKTGAAAVSGGALAVGSTGNVVKDGIAFGMVVNVPKEKAAETALARCRTFKAREAAARCKVVATFTGQCFAVAYDPQPGTPGAGWGIGPDQITANLRAIAMCEDTAGPGRRGFCQVETGGCDTAN